MIHFRQISSTLTQSASDKIVLHLAVDQHNVVSDGADIFYADGQGEWIWWSDVVEGYYTMIIYLCQ